MPVPASLKRAEDQTSGCVFVLDDDRNIRLDVSYSDIDHYLTEIGFPSLDAVAQSGKSNVYSLPIRMASSEWETISRILTSSEHVKSILADFPVLSAQIQLAFDAIESLAQRLYGGVGEPFPGVVPTFYLSHPIDFTFSDHRDDAWRYALLSHQGGHVFKTHVNTENNTVEIEHSVIKNHFVEGRLDVHAHYNGIAR